MQSSSNFINQNTNNRTTLRIMQLNLQSINNKIDLLEKLMAAHNIDIALVQETWTKPDQSIKLKHYNSIFKSRENHRGGGVAIFIKKSLPYFTIPITTYDQVEHTEIKVKVNGNEFHFISFYNPNQSRIQKTVQALNLILEINKNNERTIIGGDINAKNGLWNDDATEDELGKLIADVITTSNFSILNNGQNTHMNMYNNNESAIDITMVSQDLVSKSNWQIINDSIGSDHKPILIELQVRNNTKQLKTIVNNNRIIEAINNLPEDKTLNFQNFNEEIQKIISDNTQKIVTDPRKIPKIWWTEKIQRLWTIKKEKLIIYNKTKDLHTAMELKKAINKMKLEIKREKNNSWVEFMNKISKSKPGEIWKYVKVFKNSKDQNPILNDPKEAEKFLNYNFPNSTEKHKPPYRLKTKPTEFTREELNIVLKKAKNTAPGFDRISYALIKSLNEEKQMLFLGMINVEWTNGNYMEEWKTAKVIGIPKQNCDSSKFENLRPISLLPIPAKILDKLVLNKMLCFAERENCIPQNSFGFNRGKSINDLYVNLIEQIENNKKQRKKSVIIKLDIKKAFDSVNKAVLIETLKEMCFPPEYINWVYNMLTNRKVQVNASYSHTTNEGLPQGSPFSPFLFLLYTASLHKISREGIKVYQFADDILILISASGNEEAKQRANASLSLFKRELNRMKLALSVEKCSYMRIFPNFEPTFIISIDNHILEEVRSSKILGITMSNRLSLSQHYTILKQMSYKNINLLKTITYQQNGAHPKNCLNIYKATTKSQINFAQVITNHERKNINKMTQAIRNKSLRVCTGTTKSTPIIALLAETGELPSDLENKVTTLIYMAKQIHKRTEIGERILNQKSLEKFNKLINNYSFMDYIAPMELDEIEKPTNITISSTFGNVSKKSSSAFEIGFEFKKIVSQYQNWIKIYTDASKSSRGQGIGVFIVNDHTKTTERIAIKVHENLTIKTLEMIAIKEAVLIITKNHWEKVIIITDSKSSCVSLNNYNKNPTKFYEKCIFKLMSDTNSKVHIQWVPGHSEIKGNEEADRLAKQALLDTHQLTIPVECINQVIPLQDAITLIRDSAHEEWTRRYQSSTKGMFNINVNNKHPPKKPWIRKSNMNSKESRIILRMRTGHTYDKKFKALIKIEQSNICDTCQVTDDFIHAINNCRKYNSIRRNYKALRKPVQEILKQMNATEIREIINFYKEAKLEF